MRGQCDCSANGVWPGLVTSVQDLRNSVLQPHGYAASKKLNKMPSFAAALSLSHMLLPLYAGVFSEEHEPRSLRHTVCCVAFNNRFKRFIMKETIVSHSAVPEGESEQLYRFGFVLEAESGAPPYAESVTLRTARVLVAHLENGNAFVGMLKAIVAKTWPITTPSSATHSMINESGRESCRWLITG
jgi:hypothetical protein